MAKLTPRVAVQQIPVAVLRHLARPITVSDAAMKTLRKFQQCLARCSGRHRSRVGSPHRLICSPDVGHVTSLTRSQTTSSTNSSASRINSTRRTKGARSRATSIEGVAAVGWWFVSSIGRVTGRFHRPPENEGASPRRRMQPLEQHPRTDYLEILASAVFRVRRCSVDKRPGGVVRLVAVANCEAAGRVPDTGHSSCSTTRRNLARNDCSSNPRVHTEPCRGGPTGVKCG